MSNKANQVRRCELIDYIDHTTSRNDSICFFISRHIHLHQSEHFEVLSGTLGLVLNGQHIALTKEGGRVSIPAGARHTFWVHESTTEDVTMQVWVKPQGVKYGLDEGFLRNFAGYLSDCDRESIPPSLFQL